MRPYAWIEGEGAYAVVRDCSGASLPPGPQSRTIELFQSLDEAENMMRLYAKNCTGHCNKDRRLFEVQT
ncbi:hypothetical protein [Streptacidiphilus rugosus]|uniref:hypothetical protein n=1 Tax=Streptacidiphilus rugosus TaxID=405783 RepID=UPI000564C901|nr:hypothetical protein [Streptacidiphilus rugosus]